MELIHKHIIETSATISYRAKKRLGQRTVWATSQSTTLLQSHIERKSEVSELFGQHRSQPRVTS